MTGVITVVVPVRDEATTVAATLRSVAAQTIGAERIELLVLDGCSSDGTGEICRRFADAAPWHRFAVRRNAARTVPHALNAGLADARGEWFTRVDGRTTLSREYLEVCTDAAGRHGGATAVGGRLVTIADGAVATAIAAVVTHPLGVGRGFRLPIHTETEVGHHPFAVWRTEDVRSYGGFREELTRNQDDEFSMRARARGARIYVTPAAVVSYRPRTRIRGLAAQYFQYGLWKAAVGRSTGLFPLQSVAPAAVTAGAAAALGAAVTGRSRLPLALALASYGTAAAAVSLTRPGARPDLTLAALAAAHLSYGTGVLCGAAAPTLTRHGPGQARVR
ncbi:MAG TPA: glycosyltransferase [Solirubrobacteraceae bacterium]